MPDTDPLLLQTLTTIHDNVTALRNAFDEDKNARRAHESIVDARLAAHDRLFSEAERERNAERARKTGYVTSIVAILAAAVGGAITSIVDRLMQSPPPHH